MAHEFDTIHSTSLAQEPGPPASRPWWRRRAVIWGAVIVVLAGVILGVTLSRTSKHVPPVTMSGVVLVEQNGGGSLNTGQACPTDNLGPYADITIGTTLTILNGSGVVVGQATLASGLSMKATNGSPVNDCAYSFTATDLPASTYYQLQIPGHGQVTVAKADADHVSLTLGTS